MARALFLAEADRDSEGQTRAKADRLTTRTVTLERAGSGTKLEGDKGCSRLTKGVTSGGAYRAGGPARKNLFFCFFALLCRAGRSLGVGIDVKANQGSSAQLPPGGELFVAAGPRTIFGATALGAATYVAPPGLGTPSKPMEQPPYLATGIFGRR